MFFSQLASQGTQGFPLFALFAAHQLAGRAGRAAFDRGLRLQLAAQFQRHFTAQQRPAAVAQTQTTVAFNIDIGQTTGHQLTEKRAPITFAAVFADTKHRQVLMTHAADFFVFSAQQHIDQVPCAITLAGTINRRQRLTRRLGCVPGLHAIDTVVAMPARLRHVFVEICEQGLTAAAGFFAQRQHRIELVMLKTLVSLIAFGVLQHLLEHHHVLQTVGHPRISWQAVTPCPTGFLVIGLE